MINAYDGMLQRSRNKKDSVSKLLNGFQSENWETHTAGVWVMFTPKAQKLPVQGWKGHLSCTVSRLPKLLNTVIPIFFRRNCAFKTVVNKSAASILNDIHYPVSGANKLVTFYPETEERFRELMEELYDATLSFKGPPVFTDMNCSGNSVLHYRYGAFQDNKVFNAVTGTFVNYIQNPDGTWTEDKRDPWFQAPRWASLPFDREHDMRFFPEKILVGKTALRQVAFEGIISRANKGNVYRATHQEHRIAVIVKESHANVMAGGKTDMREVMRNECALLKDLAPSGSVPVVYDCFECGRNMYLIEEYIDGTALSRIASQYSMNPAIDRTMIIKKMQYLIEEMHDRGVVINDLSPNNFILDNAGHLYLIDLEFSFRTNDVKKKHLMVKTIGFDNPEESCLCDDITKAVRADYFAAAVSMLTLFFGQTPFFTKDAPGAADYRSVSDKLRQQICMAKKRNRLGEGDARRIRKMLAKSACLPDKRGRTEAITKRHVLSCCADFLKGLHEEVHCSIIKKSKRIFSSSEFGESTAAYNVQHGIAGCVAVLLEMRRIRGLKEQAEEILREIKPFISKNVKQAENEDASMLFGQGGFIWALNDYGIVMKDDLLVKEAINLAGKMHLPDEPDYALGYAGVGYLFLKLWFTSKDPVFLDKTIIVSDKLKSNARELLQKKDPLIRNGFAHGWSGVTLYLYLAARAIGDESLTDTANEWVYQYLIPAAEDILIKGLKDRKPIDISWCKGLSGIGLALAKISRYTKSDVIAYLLKQSASCLKDAIWTQSDCFCHGNAGIIEFLMSAYDETQDEDYCTLAREIASYIFIHRYYPSKHTVRFPDETMLTSRYDYGTGDLGIIRSLLRACRLVSGTLFIPDVELPLSISVTCGKIPQSPK